MIYSSVTPRAGRAIERRGGFVVRLRVGKLVGEPADYVVVGRLPCCVYAEAGRLAHERDR